MKARILSAQEWTRVEQETTENPLIPNVLPENMAVVVVEEEGQIIASLSVLKATHFEGLWVRPDKRGNAGVMRALIRQAVAIPRIRGESWVFSGAASGRMRGFVERLGGVKVPMDLYVMGLGAN